MTRQVGLCDIEVPRAVILRKIKSAANNRPVQKEAKLALTKAVTVFISYLSAQALAEVSLEPKGGSKSLSMSQVLEALSSIGFSNLQDEVVLRVKRHQAHVKERAEQKAANVNMPSEPDSEGIDDEELGGTSSLELPIVELDGWQHRQEGMDRDEYESANDTDRPSTDRLDADRPATPHSDAEGFEDDDPDATQLPATNAL